METGHSRYFSSNAIACSFHKAMYASLKATCCAVEQVFAVLFDKDFVPVFWAEEDLGVGAHGEVCCSTPSGLMRAVRFSLPDGSGSYSCSSPSGFGPSVISKFKVRTN